MNYSFFAILPKSLAGEFFKEVLLIEEMCGLIRYSEKKEKGNTYSMKGDTYHISYEKRGKYKKFEKKMKLVWIKINEKYSQTQWKGK